MRTTRTSRPSTSPRRTPARLLATGALLAVAGTATAAVLSGADDSTAAAGGTASRRDVDGTTGQAFSATERAIREGVTHPWVVHRPDGAYLVRQGAGGEARILVSYASTGAGGR